MTDQELEAMMRRVLLDSMEPEQDEENAPPFVPSAAHRRQMDAMLKNPRRWAGRRQRPAWSTTLRRAAAVFAAAFLGLGGLAAASPSARAEIARWASEWSDNEVGYIYSGEDFSGEMPIYEISKLPDGYTEDIKQRVENLGYVRKVYQSKDGGENIYLRYAYMQEGTAIWYTYSDDTEVLDVTVNGCKGQLFAEKDWEHARSAVSWIDNRNNFQFDVIACMEKDDILHMAESVSLVKTEK